MAIKDRLTDPEVRNAEPADKPRKLYDGGGLSLLIKPTGAKGWRFKYRYGGKHKEISFGPYPTVTLAKAREKRREFLVPLADQAVEVLKELRKLKLNDRFVFPSFLPDRPLSENAFSVALKTMGYPGDVHQPHGFRSTASTLLHEMNFDYDAIETQLDHSRPGVHGIYNRAHLLPQRTQMMQAWSDHLDSLRTGGNVVAIKAKEIA